MQREQHEIPADQRSLDCGSNDSNSKVRKRSEGPAGQGGTPRPSKRSYGGAKVSGDSSGSGAWLSPVLISSGAGLFVLVGLLPSEELTSLLLLLLAAAITNAALRMDAASDLVGL